MEKDIFFRLLRPDATLRDDPLLEVMRFGVLSDAEASHLGCS